MQTDGRVDLLVPLAAVERLEVPPRAVGGGSPEPCWVELPCRGGYLYGRRRLMRLPFDPGGARVARRWVRFDRWRRFSSPVYRWAAGACVVAGGGVWWFGLRDGNFGTITLLAFVLVLGGAVGNGFKALPLGFDDPEQRDRPVSD